MLRPLVAFAMLAAGCFGGPSAASAECEAADAAEGARAATTCPPGFFCRGGVCLAFNTPRSDVVDPDLVETPDAGDAATP